MLNAEGNADKSQTHSQASGPLITVAICTRNRVNFLQRAVESVLPQMTDGTELLIVDNASTDDTPEVTARLATDNPRLTVCRENEIGISAARNTALKKAHGQYVLFLDDDDTAEPGWLAAYQRFLSTPPSGKIAVVGGAVFPYCETPPPKWINVGTGFNRGDSPKRLPYRDSPLCTNSAYSREAALAVGMFDTQLGRKGNQMMSREESDLNLRLQDAGYEIWWLPSAVIRQFVSASRFTFRAMMRARFNEGRSIAIQRLKSRRKGLDREFYRVGRVVVTPFHMSLCLLAALFTLPWRHRQMGYLLRAILIAGIGWQMLVCWSGATGGSTMTETAIGDS
jgi:glycosyltransferase involved in cell wall biosynthesis